MRKFFASLKSVVAATLVGAMTLAVSCSYDDSAINKRVDRVEKDLAALTERVDALEKKLASEVESLEALINGKVVVVDVVTDAEGNTTIKLSNGKEITVFAAEDTLQYRVNDGVLEVSADGENWVAINGVTAEQVVANVVVNEDGTVTITLADGQEFTVVKAELIECEAAKAGVYVLPGATKEVAFCVNDAVVDINIMNQPLGWSATVEEATEAPEAGEDEGGAAPMPLAAGGQNYVLKINGPAASFKEAAKEGVVSVHFNTAAGACKVLKVNVTLAELTLAVDGDGNITITNSIAYEQTDYFGEKFVDFANFHIGVMEADVYAEYGNDAFRDNFSYGYYDANINSTQRNTGIFNIVDELMRYEEGVCDVETIQITDAQLGGAFWPTYDFEYGKEYILFVTIDSELLGGYEVPVLDNAVMANYKKSLLKAEYVSSNWKGADFKFSLAGYTHYNIGWVSTQMVEDYIGYGLATSVEDFIPFYINGMGVDSAGAIVPDENIEIGETVALADLANRSFYEWAPELMTDTEYYLFVYPFNAPNGEMDFYSLSPAAEDIYIAENTFKTGSLGVGTFDAGAQFELVSWAKETVVIEEEDYSYEVEVLTAKATFGADVTDIVYTELYEPIEDPEEGIFEVMNSYVRESAKAEGGVTIKITYPSDPTYLGVVAINAEGQGVYVQHKFEKPIPSATDVTAVSVVAEQGHYSENGGCYHNGEMKVTFTLPNDENAVIYFKTGNNEAADFIGCDAYHRPAYDYLYVGDWFDWNKSTNGKWYLGATLNGVDAVIYGPIVVGYGAEGYTFSFQIDGYKVTYTGNVPGLTVPEGYEGGEESEPEVLVMNPIARANFKNSKLQFFHQVDGANVYCAGFYNYDAVDTDKMFIPEGEYVVGTNFYVWGYSNVYDYNAGSYTHNFDAGGVMKVSEVNGAYHIEFNGTLNDGAATMEFVFDGLIENLILPSEYVGPTDLEFTPVRADYDLKLVGNNDSEYAYWLYDANNNYIEVICHYNKNTNWDYKYEGALVINGERFELSKISTQMPSNYNCAEGEKYFAIAKVEFANNTVYSYTGQLPAVEVNYEGDGADYVPGADNAGN